MRIAVINGPNLNLLGTRQPEIYGSWSLADVDSACRQWAAAVNAKVTTFQSNHEGVLIDQLHLAGEEADAIVINPGAYSHYSYAIRDAIEAIGPPTVEVHLSNIRAREAWRHNSVVSDACVTTIYGRGVDGYRDAIWHLAARDRWPIETIAYGSDPAQVGDLRIPSGDGPHRVAVLIHGGWWRDTAGRDLLDQMAVDLAERGWATWNISYRSIGSGGDWALTMTDLSSALDALATFGPEYGLDLDRVITVGHEAGGQLSLGIGARAGLPGAEAQVRPVAAAGIAPVSDLAAAHEAGLGDGAVAAFVGDGPRTAPDRYQAVSPSSLVPIGIPLLVIHGDTDTVVPAAMSREFAGVAADAGDEVIYHELETVGHDDPIRPGTAAYERVAEELDALSRRIAEDG